MKFIKFLLCLSIVSAVLGGTAAAQVNTVRLQTVATGLSSPLFATNAKDGSKRLFIVQQRGLIRVLQPGATIPTTFIDLSSKVSSSGSERGLLGLAFHPQFATNGYFFVDYTRQSDGATVIARYSATNNNTAGDINSERILLTIPQPFSNHNGGMIEFRHDGAADNLYIAMGDGGSANDPNNNAQNINSLLGKILRITPDVSGNNTNPAYTAPADNPYAGATNGADEIYAIGMRNPFRFSFDRSTHQLWAGDVGQNAIEEVDTINLGGNYGWRVYEGNSCTGNDPSLCTASNYLPPVFQYTHSGGRCSITGGYVYRGAQKTLPDGAYLYGDYCTGEYWMWFNNQQILIQDTTRSISSFGEDEDGEIYVVGLGGTVEKITAVKSSADFDGDAKTDFSVFRPSNSTWYISGSIGGAFSAQAFGAAGDVPVPEDYDGDRTTDIAVFRPSNGTWYTSLDPATNYGAVQFGTSGDIPAAGDYDGDGRADLTVFRPSSGVWYRLNSADGTVYAVQFGASGDIPAAADYDGDGKLDICVFRPSSGVWYRLNSTNGAVIANNFGISGDVPVPGDYDGDRLADIAVFRGGTWYIQRTTSGFVGVGFGTSGDIPVTGDYDNDGREDIGIFRPSSGEWYVLQSSNSQIKAAAFGTAEDLPAPRYDRP